MSEHPERALSDTEPFEAHRPRLLGLAYRMLGSVASAEDMVQETWLRWAQADGVRSPGAWLTTVCTRLCLDELSSARVRKEKHVGPWLPEPWISDEPPEPGPMGESLSMAFLLLLEELSPRERAAFLLREVFEEDYEHIALVLETSAQNVRQWVRRSREALEADRPRFDADPLAQAALLAAFGAAVATGDPKELEKLLADEVIATSDGGGRAFAARRPIHGAPAVAKFITGVARKLPAGVEYTPAWVNGGPGVIARWKGQVFSVSTLEIRDGRIWRWRAVLDPLKLGHLGPVLTSYDRG
jgi:RNA polymerase sigma-70 factor (ECF subfamily)